MNRAGLVLTSVVIVALAGRGLGQQTPRPGSEGSGRAWRAPGSPRQAERSLLLEALDTDHNGIIDSDEIANAPESLQALDKNNDGRLTANEYLPSAPAYRPGRRPPPGLRPAAALTVAAPDGGLGNFGVVDQKVLRGAQPSAVGILILRALGVGTIIDLRLPDQVWAPEKAEAVKSGILYTNLPMESATAPSREQVNAILAAIASSPGRVFVHCQAGKDRTGAIIACYRIAQHKWTSEEALREAVDFRMARTSVELKDFVTQFGKPPAAPGPRP